MHTDAGVIPEDWRADQLGNYVRITSGESPSQIKFTTSGLPYFKVEQLSNSDKYLVNSSTPYHFCTGKTVPRGSVIFAKRGAAIALNKVRLLADESFMDTNLMALTPINGLVGEFLFYALGYVGLWRLADTTSVPQINNKHIKPLFFALPNEEEQRAIATALSDVDALLVALEQLFAKKRDLKQAAMQQLLTGQTRLPGFHGDWEVKRLGDLLTVRHGKSQHDITAPDGKYPILASGGEIGRTNTFIYDKPSVLIGRKGTIDSPQYVDSPFWTVDTLFFTEIADEADAKFVFYKFTMIRWRSYNEASGVPSLNAKTIENIEIQTPHLPEQIAIAAVLSDMDAELDALEQRLAKTRALKQGMMQELLTGRTRLL